MATNTTNIATARDLRTSLIRGIRAIRIRELMGSWEGSDGPPMTIGVPQSKTTAIPSVRNRVHKRTNGVVSQRHRDVLERREWRLDGGCSTVFGRTPWSIHRVFHNSRIRMTTNTTNAWSDRVIRSIRAIRIRELDPRS